MGGKGQIQKVLSWRLMDPFQIAMEKMKKRGRRFSFLLDGCFTFFKAPFVFFFLVVAV